jgi:signal transduction histidine kinase
VAAGREKADEHRISVEVSDCAAGTQVLADRDALSMICSNLVENAVKYTRDGGHVAVRICQERDVRHRGGEG